MLIGNFFGGLGNQMFQYAMLRSLSIELNLPIGFTVDMLKHFNKNSKYQLGQVFNLNCNILSDDEINNLFNIFFRHPTFRNLFSKFNINFGTFYFEKNLMEAQNFKINKFKNAFFFGYWQNEEYFKKNKNLIINDFKFIFPTDQININHYNNIKSSNSVSVHIRRGDYKTSKAHNLLDIDYYTKSINLLENQLKDLNYFIFSDDMEWVKLNFPQSDKFHFISNNTLTPQFDMFLMSNCNFNIIANSSFSWWAAYLNLNTNKIIIAPSNWYKNSRCNILPKEWVII